MENGKNIEAQQNIEEVKNQPDNNTQPKADENQTDTPKEQTKTVEEQLAEMKVQFAKMQKQVQTANSEAANYKRQLREKQSVDEIALQEKAEREAAEKEEYARVKKELEHIKLSQNYMASGYTKELADKAATAFLDGDRDEIFRLQNEFLATHDNNLKAEWQKTIPQTNVGNDTDQDLFLKGFWGK